MLQGRLTAGAALAGALLAGLAGCSSDADERPGAVRPPDQTVADGPVPIATLDIVTATEPLDADELYATFDRNQIESVGGEACARELAAIIAAGETYLARRGSEPADIAELVDSGMLADTPERWELVGDELLPTPDGGCAEAG